MPALAAPSDVMEPIQEWQELVEVLEPLKLTSSVLVSVWNRSEPRKQRELGLVQNRHFSANSRDGERAPRGDIASEPEKRATKGWQSSALSGHFLEGLSVQLAVLGVDVAKAQAANLHGLVSVNSALLPPPSGTTNRECRITPRSVPQDRESWLLAIPRALGDRQSELGRDRRVSVMGTAQKSSFANLLSLS